MDFIFSKREIARVAAVEAEKDWMARSGRLASGFVEDRVGCMVNAALAALPEPPAMKRLADLRAHPKFDYMVKLLEAGDNVDAGGIVTDLVALLKGGA